MKMRQKIKVIENNSFNKIKQNVKENVDNI